MTVSAAGTIAAPDKPGIGFEVNLSRVESLTVRKKRSMECADQASTPAGAARPGTPLQRFVRSRVSRDLVR